MVKSIIYITATVITAMFLFPILWILLSSLKTIRQSLSMPPEWLFIPTAKNYLEFFRVGGARSLLHSVIITVGTIAITLPLGAVGGYALARLNLRWSEAIAFCIIATRFVPPITLIIPYYILAQRLGLIDTFAILILINTSINLPYVIWILRGFLGQVAVEIEESAMIDGCSRIGVFLRIVVPNSVPGLGAAAVLAAVFAWNEFFFALSLTSSNMRPITMFLVEYMGELGVEDWPGIAAAGIVSALPIFILYTVFQRYLVRGLTFGAVN
jgi:multiple sugar transport system permease protein